MNKQRGFTLVKVLLLSTMAGVIVFGAMKETLVQERLSGNFQKSMNARFLSEKGIYDMAEQLRAKLVQEPWLTRDELVAVQEPLKGGGEIGDDLKYDVSAHAHPDYDDIIIIVSSGERYSGDSNDRIVAYYKFKPATKSPVNDSLIAGCMGVTLKGSGLIDSYDSSQGSYEETKGSNALITTGGNNAHVYLQGHSIIKGDVNSTGGVYLTGSSPIYGNVKANGNVEISSGGGVRVDGNVETLSDFIHRGGEISGYVRASGDATMEWGASIANLEGVDLDIKYGGSGTFPDGSDFYQDGIHYSAAKYNVDPGLIPLETYTPDSEQCDPAGIISNMGNVIGNSNAFLNYTIDANDYYTFTPTRVGYETRQGNSGKVSDSGVILATQQNVYTFDENAQRYQDVIENDSEEEYVFGMKSFSLSSNGNVTIQGGDVIFLVDGDFSITGGSSLTIKDDSSLTLFVTGKVELGGSGDVIVERHGLTSGGHATFSIYSNKSGEAISLSGDSDMYSVIYAPLATIDITGNGSIYGSILGSYINGQGNPDFHFDEALKTVVGGGSSGSGDSTSGIPTLTFDRWFYRLPESVKAEISE
ncbi:DUF7305 domain-containing protein [Pseudoalteromonas sp. T1lg65]|uniref:DUF7305 domain-containing protein n=1 Tax=Pseudoalteromonas sp. T1lg65 TaxID=2077101 RepID=UPI003F793C23